MFADETAGKRPMLSKIFSDSQIENTKLTIGIEFYDKIVEFKEKFINGIGYIRFCVITKYPIEM